MDIFLSGNPDPDLSWLLLWILLFAVAVPRHVLRRQEQQETATSSVLQEWLTRLQEGLEEKSGAPATEPLPRGSATESAAQCDQEARLSATARSATHHPHAAPPPPPNEQIPSGRRSVLRKRPRPSDWREGIVLATVFGPPRGTEPYEPPQH